MGKQSAGILMYRKREFGIEVLLVHPGGPCWVKKDAGAWSIPKGEFREGEDALAAARREFEEETGFPAEGLFIPLGAVKYASGKKVHAWAVQGDVDTSAVRSNTFSMEWPPGSGKVERFPEVDRAAWFTLDEARSRILRGQALFLDRLGEKV